MSILSSIKQQFQRLATRRPRRAAHRPAGDVAAPLFIGTLPELRQLAANPPPPKTRIILTGDLVLVSDDPATPEQKDYLRQPDRLTHSLFGNRSDQQSRTIRIWVHQAAYAITKQLSRHRFHLAVDQFLRYGWSNASLQCLVTGHPTDSTTIVTIYTFKNRLLTSITEKTLPVPSAPRFSSELQQLVDNLQRTHQSLAIAAPLPSVDGVGISNIGNSVYRKLSYQPVTDSHTGRPISKSLFPFLLIGSGIASYAGAIIVPFNEYDTAQTRFREAAASLPTNTSFGASELQAMQQRRFALTMPREQEGAAELLTRLAKTAAAHNALITKVTLNFQNPSTNNNPAPALAFTLRVSSQSGTPLDVAKPILDRFSTALNLDLNLALSNSFRPVTQNGESFMFFDVEASFPRTTTPTLPRSS